MKLELLEAAGLAAAPEEVELEVVLLISSQSMVMANSTDPRPTIYIVYAFLYKINSKQC